MRNLFVKVDKHKEEVEATTKAIKEKTDAVNAETARLSRSTKSGKDMIKKAFGFDLTIDAEVVAVIAQANPGRPIWPCESVYHWHESCFMENAGRVIIDPKEWDKCSCVNEPARGYYLIRGVYHVNKDCMLIFATDFTFNDIYKLKQAICHECVGITKTKG